MQLRMGLGGTLDALVARGSSGFIEQVRVAIGSCRCAIAAERDLHRQLGRRGLLRLPWVEVL